MGIEVFEPMMPDHRHIRPIYLEIATARYFASECEIYRIGVFQLGALSQSHYLNIHQVKFTINRHFRKGSQVRKCGCSTKRKKDSVLRAGAATGEAEIEVTRRDAGKRPTDATLEVFDKGIIGGR